VKPKVSVSVAGLTTDLFILLSIEYSLVWLNFTLSKYDWAIRKAIGLWSENPKTLGQEEEARAKAAKMLAANVSAPIKTLC
jgi:hypothetical protein